MDKLAKALLELEVLVEYGTYYLAKKNNNNDLSYIARHYSVDEIYDDYDIKDFVQNRFDPLDIYSTDDMLGDISNYDLRNYLYENCDIDDFVGWIN